MKPKTFKIGDEVPLPDGTTGIFVELSEIGEMRIEGESRTWWLYPDDIDLGEANLQEPGPGHRTGHKETK